MVKLAISIGCLETGGAEIFVLNLLKKLDYKRFNVLLIVLSSKKNTFLEEQANNLPIKIIYMDKKEGFRPWVMYKVYKILKQYSPDIIHGNIGGLIYFFLYLFLNKNIKAIHTNHTLSNLEFGKFKRILIKRFYINKQIIPVAISQAVKNSIIETYKIDKNLIYLISNGIDNERFHCIRNYIFDPIVIGHVGRFEKVKNHETIVKVYKKIIEVDKDIKLKLIGNGSLFSEIKNQTKNLDTVEMIASTDNVAEHLKNIDIFFFPSVYEGMSLSLIEALASGTVIIASKVGGNKDLIVDGVNGYLIEDCFDVEAFVNAFLKIIENKSSMISMSKNNIEKARHYDLNNMVKQYQTLYLQEVRKC